MSVEDTDNLVVSREDMSPKYLSQKYVSPIYG